MVKAAGFVVSTGQMGENVTTRGVDLLRKATGTRLYLGDTAVALCYLPCLLK
jgi:MOSC domain-containing protein YiiM